MVYSYTDPVLKLPYLTPKRTYAFSKDAFQLIVRPVEKGDEEVIKEFKISLTKTEPLDPFGNIEPKLGWYEKGYLQYAVVTSGFKEELDTGNNFILPDGKGDTYVSPTWEPKSKIINSFPVSKNNLEIFPVGPSKAIFVFDHAAKKVRFFVGDKTERLPKYRPYTEPLNQ